MEIVLVMEIVFASGASARQILYLFHAVKLGEDCDPKINRPLTMKLGQFSLSSYDPARCPGR